MKVFKVSILNSIYTYILLFVEESYECSLKKLLSQVTVTGVVSWH